MQKFVVDQGEKDRLDVFLVSKIPQLSRSSIVKLCNDHKVLVNGEKQPTKYKVKPGNEITVYFDPKDLDEIPDITLPILYEDNDCLVIDKPTGVLTHSKGGFNPEATVATFIRDKIKDMDGERAGIVHRLDRATSGVIICAKTPEALRWLQKQFSSRKVKKQYIAVIEGSMNPPEAIIDMPIARNPRNPKTFHVSQEGKTATTSYKTIKVNNKLSLLELAPETGRTHQLRVHLAHQGHPIVGDMLYGGKKHERLMLHAQMLEITLPNRERKVFAADVPEGFAKIMS